MKEQYPKDIKAVVETVNRARNDSAFILDVIQDSLQVKISYMENDEFDMGRRNLLNYGHCFGHAVRTLVLPITFHTALRLILALYSPTHSP